MESPTIEIKVAEGVKELRLMQGKAENPKEPKIINIEGSIGAPAEFYRKKKKNLVPEKCHVLFSYAGMFIKLIINEQDYYAGTVEGKTCLNPELEAFGINKNKIFTISDLKSFLKMNRIHFTSAEENMKLVSDLEKFNAQISAEITKEADSRGNKNDQYTVKVNSNLALKFNLNISIFTGEAKKKFQVEVCCDYREKAVSVWLESAELNEIILSERERLITANVEPFKELFAVIEQPK